MSIMLFNYRYDIIPENDKKYHEVDYRHLYLQFGNGRKGMHITFHKICLFALAYFNLVN